MPPRNTLYYGDNLPVLRDHIATESVDLIYLDPPFNSKQSYNVLFQERDGKRAAAQVKAFTDTWRWTSPATDMALEAEIERGTRAGEALKAFYTLLGQSDLMAYLVMMAPRLSELHRVLKPTGSLYLHCDPTASHYLKILLDAVFDADRFRSEIVWRRSNAHNKVSRQYGPIHDTILFYTKSDDFTFRVQYRPHTKGYIKAKFRGEDEKGPFRTNVLTGPGTRTGDSGKPWGGFDPTSVGRHWAIPASLTRELPAEAGDWTTQKRLDYLHARGHVRIPRQGKGQPEYVQRVSQGVPLQDIWAYQTYSGGLLYGTDEGVDEDVRWLESEAESLGYPTQKPLGLLARIIQTSSNPGDVVLDPFCGCGTAIAAAQKLGRRWVGIDITQVAIGIIRHRLAGVFGQEPGRDYAIVGQPVTVYEAEALAKADRFQFQVWAVNTLAGRPVEAKKGADKGIDGKLFFHDEAEGGKTKTVLISVKSGGVGVGDVRDLRGTVEREKAAIGVLVTLDPPTKPMRQEAAAAGAYVSPGWGRRYAKLQIITVEEMLHGGDRIDMPPVKQTNTTLPPVKPAKKPRRRGPPDLSSDDGGLFAGS